MNSNEQKENSDFENDGVLQFLSIVKEYSGKIPDKIYPQPIKRSITPELAAVLSFGIGLFDDLVFVIFTNYFGVLLTLVFSIVGIYLGLYSVKWLELKKNKKELVFATVGVVLSLLNILYTLFVFIPDCKNISALEREAESLEFITF